MKGACRAAAALWKMRKWPVLVEEEGSWSRTATAQPQALPSAIRCDKSAAGEQTHLTLSISACLGCAVDASECCAPASCKMLQSSAAWGNSWQGCIAHSFCRQRVQHLIMSTFMSKLKFVDNKSAPVSNAASMKGRGLATRVCHMSGVESRTVCSACTPSSGSANGQGSEIVHQVQSCHALGQTLAQFLSILALLPHAHLC